MRELLVRVFSDLHYEHTFAAQHGTRAAFMPYPEFWAPKELDTDKNTVLILAGDLYNGIRSIPIIKSYHKRFKSVLIVLGNHDFYGEDVLTLASRYKDELSKQKMYNVHLLDRDVVKIKDVVFIGAPLWTNMNGHDPMTVMSYPNYMVPDYNYIKAGAGEFDDNYISRQKKFDAKTWLDLNNIHFQYIKKLTELNRDEKVCIITHHGWTFAEVAEKFKSDIIGNGYFFSEYSGFIMDNPNIKYIFHGHTHSPVDIMVGETRIIANPFGYPRENQMFNESSVYVI